MTYKIIVKLLVLGINRIRKKVGCLSIRIVWSFGMPVHVARDLVSYGVVL